VRRLEWTTQWTTFGMHLDVSRIRRCRWEAVKILGGIIDPLAFHAGDAGSNPAGDAQRFQRFTVSEPSYTPGGQPEWTIFRVKLRDTFIRNTFLERNAVDSLILQDISVSVLPRNCCSARATFLMISAVFTNPAFGTLIVFTK